MYMGQWIRVVYDVDQEKLLTALPPKPPKDLEFYDANEAKAEVEKDLDVKVLWRE